MKLISDLERSLNRFLCWDKRRTNCLVKLVIALISVQTVNLKKLSCAIFSDSKVDSTYRRLQRFFAGSRINYNNIAKFMVTAFKLNQGKHYLILDRTNWQWGKCNLNILFLCIAYKKTAIPIFWLVLNKKGNSSTRERIALVQRFISVFGTTSIAGILGDREFIGKHWFSYLKDKEMAFYFRIKKDANTKNANGKSIAVSWLFFGLRPNHPKSIGKPKPIYGHKLFVSGMCIESDYLIIVTNQIPDSSHPDEAIKIYGIRWEIETLFGCLKSKGFHFEDTHIVHRDRIKKLIAALAIAFCWSHLTGEWRDRHEKQIRIKKHGRPSRSLFRYGLDWIMHALMQRGQKLRRLSRVFGQIIGNSPPDSTIKRACG